MKTIHNSDTRGNSNVQNHKTHQWGKKMVTDYRQHISPRLIVYLEHICQK